MVNPNMERKLLVGVQVNYGDLLGEHVYDPLNLVKTG